MEKESKRTGAADAYEASNSFEDNITVVDSFTSEGLKVEIQEYNSLGSVMLPAQTIHFMNKVGRRLKRVRVVLNGGDFRAESQAMHYLVGKVEIDVDMGKGVVGFAKKLAKGAVTNVTPIQPRYHGHGEVYLEPTWGHYALLQLKNEEAVMDKGMYHASEGSVTVDVSRIKNLKTAAIGDTGFFQIRVHGTGWVLIKLPVPMREVQKIALNDDCLKVEGEAGVLRKGNITYTMERSVRSWIRAAASGETYLHCFRGTGEVWLLPTFFTGEEARRSA